MPYAAGPMRIEEVELGKPFLQEMFPRAFSQEFLLFIELLVISREKAGIRRLLKVFWNSLENLLLKRSPVLLL
jgi:hypothetical protein